MRDSLLEFLRIGILSPVCLDMRSNEVFTELGQPDDVSYQSIKAPNKSSIWLFGSPSSSNLQLFFQDEQIKGIGLYLWGNLDIQSLPSVFAAENWEITGRTAVEEFTQLLNRERITWDIHQPLTFDRQICILVQSNAHAFWSPEDQNGL